MQAPDSGEASSTVDDDLAPGIEVVRQAHGVDLALGRGDRPWTLPIDTLVVSAGPSDGLGTLGSTVRRAMPGLSWNDIRYRDLEPDVPQFLTVSEEGRRRAGGRLRELVVATVREPSRSGDAVASVRSAVRATAAALDAAQGRGATAIGLPLLGAGAAGLDAAAVAAAVVPLVVEQAASARGLRRVVFVCDDDPTEDVIRRAVAGAPGGGPGGRLALRTGAQELVDFTDAVRRARNGSRATGQDALLAVLVRRNRTRLDRGELDRGASAALLRVLPSGDVEERLARALAAAGANADEVLSPGRIRRDVDPGASELADVVGAAERLATLLGGREPRQQQVWSHHIAAAALADLLSPDVAAALGASRATLRSALRDGIGERWPDEDVQRLDWFWADADGARAAVTRYSDVLSDAESPEDAIGITADVHAMAALLAATATAPPLSVALLGNWGSGKSTFMNLLHQRVAALEELARQDETSPFSPIVRQVRFNAWHLSDDHVWVGVVEHLFHGLRGPAQVPEGEVLADGESVSRLRADLAKAEDRRRALERGLDRIDELDRVRAAGGDGCTTGCGWSAWAGRCAGRPHTSSSSVAPWSRPCYSWSPSRPCSPRTGCRHCPVSGGGSPRGSPSRPPYSQP